MIHPSTFFEEGKKIFRGRKKTTKHRRSLHKDLYLFRAFFGTWPCICAELWHRTNPYELIHPKSRVVHLLWALLWMCNYSIEAVNGSMCGVDEDTFRKWAFPWISAISTLTIELIDWEDRFEGNWHYWTFVVDGVHCPIYEPRRPFWTGWFSHKFNGAGLAYEVATAVTTGKIIWINGPFPAGKWPDYKIFINGLAKLVKRDIERGVSDAGYWWCDPWLFLPFWRTRRGMIKGAARNDLHDYLRARQEQLNSRFHKFNCLSSIFRHQREMHGDCFHAVGAIVQLEIIHGFAPQFDCIPRPWVDPVQYPPTPCPEEEYYPYEWRNTHWVHKFLN